MNETPEGLATSRINLETRLQAMDAINLYGMSIEDRIKLETQRIEAQRELTIVNRLIHEYVNNE